MDFIRLTDPSDSRMKRSLAFYACSFPPHEQREGASQARILQDGQYHFTLLMENGQEVGTLLFWESDAFVYVEHFYIYPAFRGQGCGGAALRGLEQRGKTVILEIDPPLDPVSQRRKAFYQRNGFVENPYAHVHPPYHRGSAGHPLVIMTCPGPVSQAQYEAFDDYLKKRVMAQAFEAAPQGGACREMGSSTMR